MAIARIALWLLKIYEIILIARLLMSWFPNPPEGLRPVLRVLYSLTEPVLRLVRPLIPPVRGMDFSPLLIFAVVIILEQILSRFA